MPKVAKAPKAAAGGKAKKLAEPVKAAPPPKEVGSKRRETRPACQGTAGRFLRASRLARVRGSRARPVLSPPPMRSLSVWLGSMEGCTGPEPVP